MIIKRLRAEEKLTVETTLLLGHLVFPSRWRWSESLFFCFHLFCLFFTTWDHIYLPLPCDEMWSWVLPPRDEFFPSSLDCLSFFKTQQNSLESRKQTTTKRQLFFRVVWVSRSVRKMCFSVEKTNHQSETERRRQSKTVTTEDKVVSEKLGKEGKFDFLSARRWGVRVRVPSRRST